jgi:hypothetical protein
MQDMPFCALQAHKPISNALFSVAFLDVNQILNPTKENYETDVNPKKMAASPDRSMLFNRL